MVDVSNGSSIMNTGCSARLSVHLSEPGNSNRFCLGNRLHKFVDYVVEIRECIGGREFMSVGCCADGCK